MSTAETPHRRIGTRYSILSPKEFGLTVCPN